MEEIITEKATILPVSQDCLPLHSLQTMLCPIAFLQASNKPQISVTPSHQQVVLGRFLLDQRYTG